MAKALRKLSRDTAHRLALHYAINERDSYADAYGGEGPEAERAMRLASEFRRVLREEFGEITSEDALAEMSKGSLVTLEEIAARVGD